MNSPGTGNAVLRPLEGVENLDIRDGYSYLSGICNSERMCRGITYDPACDRIYTPDRSVMVYFGDDEGEKMAPLTEITLVQSRTVYKLNMLAVSQGVSVSAENIHSDMTLRSGKSIGRILGRVGQNIFKYTPRGMSSSGPVIPLGYKRIDKS